MPCELNLSINMSEGFLVWDLKKTFDCCDLQNLTQNSRTHPVLFYKEIIESLLFLCVSEKKSCLYECVKCVICTTWTVEFRPTLKNTYGIFILEESKYYENMFLLFLAKLQFDFDVEFQTPGFRQYETYRNSFAIWKKFFLL